MAVDKASASNPLPASEMHSNAPTLPAGFAYNAQNWLVMQPAGQDSPVALLLNSMELNQEATI
ncbi:hypothetical protein NFG21_04160 [Proteus mirabilis]|uniref:hypothetical protein n=1 Tax=Proteus mirabilis TaxID=584 RepID=UPI0023F62A14|nr:hypothetical protein [Proteus mirabilis]MDF7369841.1 hypothetical protein [Proteus mirabilis]